MSDELDLPEPKKKRGVSGLITTLVIGGAIGSVLGLAFAPQRGSKTRKVLKEKADVAVKEGKKFLKEHEKEIDQIKTGGLEILSDLKDQMLENKKQKK